MLSVKEIDGKPSDDDKPGYDIARYGYDLAELVQLLVERSPRGRIYLRGHIHLAVFRGIADSEDPHHSAAFGNGGTFHHMVVRICHFRPCRSIGLDAFARKRLACKRGLIH